MLKTFRCCTFMNTTVVLVIIIAMISCSRSRYQDQEASQIKEVALLAPELRQREKTYTRIKFADLDQYGDILFYAHTADYDSLLATLPKGWSKQDETFQQGRAWVVTKGDAEVGIVEHESGPAILVGVAVNLISTAIIEFTKWAWNKWQKRAVPQAVSTLIYTCPDGRTLSIPNPEVERIGEYNEMAAKLCR